MSLTTGLIHHWPLSEASGRTLTDAIGGIQSDLYHTDAAGTETVVTGLVGTGRDLTRDGSRHGFIELWYEDEDLTYSFSSWSFSIALKHSVASPAITPELISMGPRGASNSWFAVFFDSDNAGIWLTMRDDTLTFAQGTAVIVPDNAWHQVTVVCDGTNTVLWYDGTAAITLTGHATPLLLKQWDTLIGRDPGGTLSAGTGYFQGAVDEISAWSRALTSQEVADLWNSGSGVELVEPPPPVITPGFEPPALAAQFSKLVVDDGVLDPITIPISSWQATLQSDRSSFAQVVIPAALPWVDALTSRLDTGEIIVSHGYRLPDGTEQSYEVVRMPVQQFYIDRGPVRATARLSSYTTIAASSSATTYALKGVRSLSQFNGLRVRCDLDPLVRPGNTVYVDGQYFVAAYINYYANETDRYMDVGERLL